jgi:heat shock protein HtpX
MGNAIRTTIYLTVLTVLFMLIGKAIGGNTGMVVAFFAAFVMNIGAYWFSDKMVLRMYNAQPVGKEEAPELYQIVKTLADRDKVPMPALYIVDDPTPNAFATGRNPRHAAVAATTGILRITTPEELTGVIAHEMSHVYHRDILISSMAATIAGAITLIAKQAMFFGRGGDSNGGGGNKLAGGVGAILMLVLAPLAATLIQLAVSRSREYAADEAGARLCQHPLWLASALEKLENENQQNPMPTAQDHPETAHMFIVNPLSGGPLSGLYSTHPPTEKRIARLKAMARQLGQ